MSLPPAPPQRDERRTEALKTALAQIEKQFGKGSIMRLGGDAKMDIDGITTHNAGRLFHDDRDALAPSTPAGGMALLKYYQIPLAGQHAVVIGRSPVVGRPMAAMLLAENATVTNCHSRTRDIAAETTISA